MKAFFYVITGVALLSYPFIIYMGINSFSPQILALIVLLLLTMRLVVIKQQLNVLRVGLFAVILLFCVLTMLSSNTIWLRYYPVIMSLGMASYFLSSLSDEQPAIEVLARKVNPKGLPPQATPYLYKLTILWGMLLIVNAAIAAYTACCSSVAVWTFYNGFLSYVLMALFMASEWVYRQFKIKKHKIHS